jgi:protein SCO1/2
MELFERFDKIPMPNLRMDEKSAQSIIAFLQEETDRQHPPVTPLAAAEEPEHHHAIAAPQKALMQ